MSSAKDSALALDVQLQHLANQWLLRQQQGLSVVEEQELNQWLAADPAHAKAFNIAADSWAFSALLADDPELSKPLPVVEKQKSVWVQWLSNLFSPAVAGWSIAMLLIIVLLQPLQQQWQLSRADYISDSGVVQEITLADSSRIVLGSESAIAVKYDRQQRRLLLLQGEAVFYPAAISATEPRPFVVEAGDSKTQALGTVFYVNLADTIQVGVLEHSVQVTADNHRLQLQQGQAARYSDDEGLAASNLDLQQETSWVRGNLVFKQRSLRHIVDRLNRYQTQQVVIVNPEAAEKQLTAVFQLDDLESALINVVAELQLERVDILGITLLY